MIERLDTNEEWAHSGIVVAGGWVYLSYCVGNLGQSFDAQVNGALDEMEERLSKVSLDLRHVVKIDALLRDVWNIPQMEEVFKKRFKGNYPARKTIATEFAHHGGTTGLHFQIDAVAFRG